MMDLLDLTIAAEKQNAGHEHELLHPVTYAPTGMKLTITGPDSERTTKARKELEYQVSRLQARRSSGLVIHPEKFEELRHEFLASIVIDWRVTEGGKPVPYSKGALKRLLKAGTWIGAQIEAFAGDRSPYFDEIAKSENPKKAAKADG